MICYLINQAQKRKIYIKFFISGSTAASVDLFLLYVLTDIVGLWYLLSAVFAFIAAFFVSFFLQKFWTFRNNSRKKMYKQMGLYFLVGVVNLLINTAGMYALVEKFKLMYLLAQLMMLSMLAISSFLIYRYIIFKQSQKEE